MDFLNYKKNYQPLEHRYNKSPNWRCREISQKKASHFHLQAAFALQLSREHINSVRKIFENIRKFFNFHNSPIVECPKPSPMNKITFLAFFVFGTKFKRSSINSFAWLCQYWLVFSASEYEWLLIEGFGLNFVGLPIAMPTRTIKIHIFKSIALTSRSL